MSRKSDEDKKSSRKHYRNVSIKTEEKKPPTELKQIMETISVEPYISRNVTILTDKDKSPK